MGQVTPTEQSDILYHVKSGSSIRATGKEKRVGISGCHSSSKVTIMQDGALLSWRILNPVNGKE